MDTRHLIGVADVARILGMSRGGVAAAAAAGRLPVLARIGERGTLVFDRDDIEAIAAKRAKAGAA